MRLLKLLLIALLLVAIIIAATLAFFYFFPETSEGPRETLIEFFPFLGENEIISNPTPGTEIHPSAVDPEQEASYEISERPFAGFGIVTIKDKPEVILVDQTTGNIYHHSPEERKTTRITNTTLSQAAEVSLGVKDDAAYVYMSRAAGPERLLSMITLPFEVITGEESRAVPAITFPASVLGAIAHKDFLVTTETINDEVIIASSLPDLTQREIIFSSPYSTWHLQPLDRRTVVASTRPNKITPNASYLARPEQALEKILGPRPGLSVLVSPDQTKALYSQRSGTSFSLYLYDFKTKETITLPFDTLADKCVWTNDSAALYCGVPVAIPAGLYPEDWYAGKVTFSDDLMGLDVSKPSQGLLIDNLAGVDIKELKISNNDRLLVFSNKKTDRVFVSELTF